MDGWYSQPWAQFWFGQQSPQGTVVTQQPGIPIGGGVVSVPVISGNRISDAERFQLIVAAGCVNPCSPVVMTALSIAEDGSGDPTIMSPRNGNGTYDLGLWQINSSHWADWGGPQALTVPINNARAAMGILGPHLNYCAWSTYEVSCGHGYTGAYRAFLLCAQAIADGGSCKR
jgi:hypothetical protein